MRTAEGAEYHGIRGDLHQRLAANANWLAIGRPHVAWLTTTLGHVPHAIFLTDRDGIVLDSVGSRQFIEVFGLVPGSDWSEAHMGTNAAGTALLADQPVAVAGSEHFASSLHDCTSIGAPIHAPDGTMIGTINISSRVADASAERLSLVAHAAYAIGRELAYERQEDSLRRAERGLRESEARLRAILDNTSALVYLVDDQNRFIHINRRWEDVFQLTNKQVAARSIYEFFPQQVADQFQENNRRVLEAGAPLETEEVVPLEDGLHTYITAKVPICDPSGKPYAVCGISTDITYRKRVEQEREEALVTLNTLVASAPLGIALLDTDMRYLLINGPLAEMNGIPAEDHLGKTVAQVVPGLHPQVVPIFRRVLETGKAIPDQILVGETPQAPDVKRVWRESWFPVAASNDGKPSGVGVFVQDVTEQRQAEERLRRRYEQLHLLSDLAEALLRADDPNALLPTVFAKIKPHLAVDTYVHFTVDDNEGDALRLVSSAGLPEATVQSLTRLELGQAICGTVALHRKPIVATRVQHSDDPTAELIKSMGIRAYACNPLMAGTELLGTLSFGSRSRDEFAPEELDFLKTVAYYTAAAYERARYTQQLREADCRKDEFLAMLGHELRNPLTPIRSGLDMLALQESHGHSEEIELMREQVEHLVRLADDVLDVARIRQGKVKLRRKRVELSDLVRRAVKALGGMIESRQQELRVSVFNSSCWLHADPVRLVQVLVNLLTNASKYTKARGRIELTAECQKGQAVISIRDTGIGIEPELLPRIFELFTQSTRSLDRAEGGLGIGLTLVQRLVQMHGGTVSAESAGIGQGSTFIVRLPIVEGPRRTDDEVVEQLPSAQCCRVLVVDDNAAAAQMFAALLSKLGKHDVQTAHDGRSALRMVRQLHPEIALIDIGLPGMDGYEVARAIRQDHEFDGLLLVALTGYDQKEAYQRSKGAGFDEHLVKPPSVEQLRKVFAHPKLKGREPEAAVALSPPQEASPSVDKGLTPGCDDSIIGGPSSDGQHLDLRQVKHDIDNTGYVLKLVVQMLSNADRNPHIIERVKLGLDEEIRALRHLAAILQPAIDDKYP